MKLIQKTIIKSLDKTYKIQPVSRPEIETFKTNYIQLINRVEESESHNESEENFKGHLMDFLKNTYFQKDHLVATKGKTDFVIHATTEATSPVAILFEVKRPKNSSEMVTRQNLNTKAMHELILYYFEERSKHQNNFITYLIITNIHEWFIFESNTFERLFYKNSKLLKEFKDWKDGRKVSPNNDLFYKEIAKPALNVLQDEIEFTYFDIRAYEKNIKNEDLEDDKKLIELYKVFSPTHLLKLKAADDTNKLNSKFYSELLHIIGLEEIKEGGKKLIQRKTKENRNEGSILENCINILESEDRLHHLKDLFAYGKSKEEQIFNIGLELCITWVNRILFLKLLEAQLQKYHDNDQRYKFLNSQAIKDFDVLNKLFFQVLAKPVKDRNSSIQAQFSKIPYLNSSLFDISVLEDDTIRINSLDDSLDLPLLKSSVIRNNSFFKDKKQINTLAYLFAFLDAYDFSSENKEDIVEENRELISASVLGLIFEKINGYRDGSFYTPAFITEYMCRETITKAVLQKFNETKNWNCTTVVDLHNKIDDINEANQIFDSLHICDPAVGSGHFLVSALNALIFMKSELGILKDRKGKRIKGYQVEVINDELIILDEEEKVFQYKVLANGKINSEVQRIQETLFHEKQTLIENCLFGVDINPNSVKICRLRLWIELLKHAYYTAESAFNELETLPNIDINIKQGNSLLSRFALNEDLSEVFQKQKFSLQTYRDAVQAYKDSKSKEAKAGLLRFINDIKEQFKESVSNRDPKRKRLSEIRGKRILLDHNVDMFGNTKADPDQVKLQKRKLDADIKKIEAEIADIEQNNLYKGSFEWRFEFPEVLDDKGDFVGFDVVIGNPPYLRFRDENINLKKYFLDNYKSASNQFDLYHLFIEKAKLLKKELGLVSFIVPNAFLGNENCKFLRKYILDNYCIDKIVDIKGQIFDDASVEVLILEFNNSMQKQGQYFELSNTSLELKNLFVFSDFLNNPNFNFTVTVDSISTKIIIKIQNNSESVETNYDVISGIKEYQIGKGKPIQTEYEVKNKVFNSTQKLDDSYSPELRGKNIVNYGIDWKGEFIKYGEWLAEPRQSDFFVGDKILIRQIPSNKKLVVGFTDEYFVIDQTAYIAKKKHNSIINDLCTLALLNSKLIFWYFQNSSNEFDSLFPKIKTKEFKNLPIYNFQDLDSQTPLIAKVEQILATKKADPTTDTSQLEAEIDAMVYKLYDLTDEEIAIVEGKS